jgi:hypothetical protein
LDAPEGRHFLSLAWHSWSQGHSEILSAFLQVSSAAKN